MNELPPQQPPRCPTQNQQTDSDVFLTVASDRTESPHSRSACSPSCSPGRPTARTTATRSCSLRRKCRARLFSRCPPNEADGELAVEAPREAPRSAVAGSSTQRRAIKRIGAAQREALQPSHMGHGRKTLRTSRQPMSVVVKSDGEKPLIVGKRSRSQQKPWPSSKSLSLFPRVTAPSA